MRSHPDTAQAFNIFCLGAWNPAILSPQWVQQNLAIDKAKEVVLAITIQGIGSAPRLSVDDIYLFPSHQSLILTCNEFNDESRNSSINMLHSIAKLLPHTPVNAIGVNFRYIADIAESAGLSELFSFSDASKIDAKSYNMTGSNIRRSFLLEDKNSLNLAIELVGANVFFEFNFEFQLQNLSDVIKNITVAKVTEIQQNSLDFLKNVYNLELQHE